MENITQQTIICIDSKTQIGVLATAHNDGVKLVFDTEGKVTPSVYRKPDAITGFDAVMFDRLRNDNKRYLMADHGYFTPDCDKDAVITIHVNETKRGKYLVTFNAYKHTRTSEKHIDPQYLGSKAIRVSAQ